MIMKTKANTALGKQPKRAMEQSIRLSNTRRLWRHWRYRGQYRFQNARCAKIHTWRMGVHGLLVHDRHHRGYKYRRV